MRPILLVLLTCGFFASTDIVARLVAETQAGNTIHPLVITFERYVAGFLLTAPVLLTRFGNIRSQVPYLYLLRSGGGVTSATCIFIGVAYLPVADVTAIKKSELFCRRLTQFGAWTSQWRTRPSSCLRPNRPPGTHPTFM